MENTEPAIEEISAPAPEPTQAEPPAQESRADRADRENEELRDDLKAVWRKSQTPRDESGKFLPKNGEPAKAAEPSKEEAAAKVITAPDPAKEAAKAEKPAETPAKTAKPAPQAWSAEAKAHWDKLPPEAQAYIAEREAQAHQKISELGQKAKAVEDLAEFVRPHMHRMGTTPPQEYISNLFHADEALARDPVEFIKFVAKQKGIDLNSLVSDPYAFADPQSAQWDAKLQASQARIDQLERQLSEVGQRVNGRDAAEREAQQQAYDKTVTEFFSDKPDGQQLAAAIQALLPAVAADNPSAPLKEVLQSAYEQARWANPATRKALLESQAKEAETKRLEEAKAAAARAKRAGSINVRGTIAQNGTTTLHDDLRAIWRRNNAS